MLEFDNEFAKAKPIIPWMGGKRRLAKHIIPIFPAHSCYVEPFAGGAALFFMKHQVKTEVLNDINGELVNLYRVVKYHLDEFVRQFRWSLVSRQMFSWLKETPVNTLTDIQRAARFYYLQKMAFGGKASSQTFGTATTRAPKLNLLRIEEELSAAHLRLSSTYVEHLPWDECVRRYDRAHTLFYLDPPYWEAEGYGVEFGFDQYQIMADFLRSIKGKMVISVSDTPEMRDVFSGFKIDRLEINYVLNSKSGSGKQSGELLIRNFS